MQESVMQAKPWTREDELELLALVQLGLQTGETEENHTVYLSQSSLTPGKTRACMIGTAVVGKFGSASAAYQEYRNKMGSRTNSGLAFIFHDEKEHINALSEMVGINSNLLLSASYKHMAGVKIAEQVELLRTNCYN